MSASKLPSQAVDKTWTGTGRGWTTDPSPLSFVKNPRNGKVSLGQTAQTPRIHQDFFWVWINWTNSLRVKSKPTHFSPPPSFRWCAELVFRPRCPEPQRQGRAGPRRGPMSDDLWAVGWLKLKRQRAFVGKLSSLASFQGLSQKLLVFQRKIYLKLATRCCCSLIDDVGLANVASFTSLA